MKFKWHINWYLIFILFTTVLKSKHSIAWFLITLLYFCNCFYSRYKSETILVSVQWKSPKYFNYNFVFFLRKEIYKVTGEGNGNPLQSSCLEHSMDGEPGGLQSTGSQRVKHNWAHRTHKITRGKHPVYKVSVKQTPIWHLEKQCYTKKMSFLSFKNMRLATWWSWKEKSFPTTVC